MKRDFGRFVLTRASLLLVLLVGFLTSPSLALATCGDYLHGNHSTALHSSGVTFPSQIPSPLVPGTRCEGPNCQRHFPSPVPNSAVEVLLLHDACLPAAMLTARPLIDLIDNAVSQRHPVKGPQGRIFRPPRSA